MRNRLCGFESHSYCPLLLILLREKGRVFSEERVAHYVEPVMVTSKLKSIMPVMVGEMLRDIVVETRTSLSSR
jgi:hypothetical protein